MAMTRDSELFRTAQREFKVGNLWQARTACQALIGRNKKNASALLLLGKIGALLGGHADAATHLAQYTRLRPDDPSGHLLLAEMLMGQGKDRQAIARFDRIPRRSAGYPFAVAGKAHLYEQRGDRDRASALIAPFTEAGTESPEMAIVQARLDLHRRENDRAVELLSRHLTVDGVRPEARANLLFLQAKALERTGRYDEAFDAGREANELSAVPFDVDHWVRQTDEIVEACSAARMAAAPRATHGSERPVLILGMPRSGTTLTERILDAHPSMFGVGELGAFHAMTITISLTIGSMLPYPACVEDIDQDDADQLADVYLQRIASLNRTAERVVDKSLFNYRHLGLIAILLPQVRVIHCRRDALDNCLSCYFEPLVAQLHPYSNDLVALGTAWRMHERLMRHWTEVLDIPILDVCYEEMVADQEAQSRRLIEFCGLPWDDQCLRYYESTGPVRTLSYDQVNRPIYKSSVGRHERFERHLGPLRDALADG